MSLGYSRETHGEVSSDEKVKANIGPHQALFTYTSLCSAISRTVFWHTWPRLQPNPGA